MCANENRMKKIVAIYALAWFHLFEHHFDSTTIKHVTWLQSVNATLRETAAINVIFFRYFFISLTEQTTQFQSSLFCDWSWMWWSFFCSLPLALSLSLHLFSLWCHSNKLFIIITSLMRFNVITVKRYFLRSLDSSSFVQCFKPMLYTGKQDRHWNCNKVEMTCRPIPLNKYTYIDAFCS